MNRCGPGNHWERRCSNAEAALLHSQRKSGCGCSAAGQCQQNKENLLYAQQAHQKLLKPPCVKARSSSVPSQEDVSKRNTGSGCRVLRTMLPNRNVLRDLSRNLNNLSSLSNSFLTYSGFSDGIQHVLDRKMGLVTLPREHKDSSSRKSTIVPPRTSCCQAGSSAESLFGIQYYSDYDDDVFDDDKEFIFTSTVRKGGPRSSKSSNKILLSNEARFFKNISPIRRNPHTAEDTILVPESAVKHETKRKNSKGAFWSPWYDIPEYGYLENIINYLFQREMKFTFSHSQISSRRSCELQRACVLDWLLGKQVQLNFTSEMYLKTVRLFDCIFFNVNIAINMYQLVALTCLWIIFKCDKESKHMDIRKVFQLFNGAFTQRQLISMEKKILIFIDFNCNVPEPISFLEYYNYKMKLSNKRVRVAAYYLLEQFALGIYCPLIPASRLAVAALYLAMNRLNENMNLWREIFFIKDYPIDYMNKTVRVFLQKDYPFKVCYHKYYTEENLYVSMLFH